MAITPLSICSSQSQLASSSAPVIYRGQYVKAVIPPTALIPGTVAIEAHSQRAWTTWTNAYDDECYALLRKIATIWQIRDGITEYTVCAKHSADAAAYAWEIAPFKAHGERIWDKVRACWQQLCTFWHIPWQRSALTVESTTQLVAAYQPYQELLQQPLPRVTATHLPTESTDVFCRADVIATQAIFSGRYTHILYDNAPTYGSADRLHFLFIPKDHRSNFNTLTSEEFREASALSRALTVYYASQDHGTSYHFHKTGQNAGQTVFHWHQHLVLTNPANELSLKLWVLLQLICGKRVLTQAEHRARVVDLRHKLTPLLERALL